MLVIQAMRRLRELPLPILVGLALMLAGAIADVIVHVSMSHDTGTAHLAHLLAIAGMTLVLAGVVVHGARHTRRPRAARQGGLDRDAHR